MGNKANKEPKEVKYWSSLDELRGIPDIDTEKAHKESVLDIFENNISGAKASRRDFLKILGFSVSSAAVLSSCERPLQKAIPYVIQPEEVTPGKALHYATTYYDGKDFANIVVKTREGRPVKIEGNPLSDFNRGGTTARIQASILELYDDARNKWPSVKGTKTGWPEINEEITGKLKSLSQSKKKHLLFTHGIISPSTKKIISEFQDVLPGLSVIEYEPISYSAIRGAWKMLTGVSLIPDLHFQKTDVVVSFNADFLGSWLAPGHFIPRYADRRRLHSGQKDMLRHYHFESGMTLTGSNADYRYMIKPEEEKNLLMNIYNRIAEHKGMPGLQDAVTTVDTDQVAEELLRAGSRSLVVSGSNDIDCQRLVASVNSLLGTVGVTVDVTRPLNLGQANDQQIEEAFHLLKSGECGAVLFRDVNPVYDYYKGKELKEYIKNSEISISFSWNRNETSEACNYVCPLPHYLEAWGDVEIFPGTLALSQPVIRSLFDTCSFQDVLLTWMGKDIEYDEYLKSFWEENFYRGVRFNDFWNKSLQDGVVYMKSEPVEGLELKTESLSDIIPDRNADGYSLLIQESIQMGDGRHANNPWLQELPDPIARVCWDNFVSVSPADAKNLGVKNGDLLKIEDLEIPVLIQAGQAPKTLSVAPGYGRKSAGKTGENIGVNVYPLVHIKNGQRVYYRTGINPQPTGENIILALTQTHNSMEGRPIVRESVLDEYLKRKDAGNEMHAEIESHHKTLYPDVEFDGLHWGLAVDLNACVGCNSCVIACQAENNVPVVGKEEVYRRRIMHWIKIDRYYSGNPEDPEVSFQPNMCQHCDNAPCENVCPVSATNHSSEGINQMSYNRCIGTKYCINNCPYRARRFNWYKYIDNEEFDFNTHSDLGRMVLNPDVTVRSRGVVEKCSFCVQRIQEKKLDAKLENRVLNDGEIQPACVQACPAGALVFGNLKDAESQVSRMFSDERNYHLLEELHTLPSVGYLTKIRNKKKS